MKKILLALAMVLSMGQAFAQSDAQYVTTEIVMSPFEAASKILKTASDVSNEIFKVSGLVQGRGVGNREQLMDELLPLNEGMMNGSIRDIRDLDRLPAMRELFDEIQSDDVKMEQVNSLVAEGSSFYRIATAVTVFLLLN